MNKRKRVAWNKHRKHIKKLEERRKAIALASGHVPAPVKKKVEPVEPEIKKPVVKKVKEQPEKEIAAPKKVAAKVETADELKKKAVKKAKPEASKAADADAKKPAHKKKSETETA